MDATRDYDEDGQVTYKVSSTKKKCDYTVRKSNDGFVFYEVGISKGIIPKEISGRFTSPEKALDALGKYLHKSSESTTVQRDKRAERRENAKSRSKSNDKEHIRQGADH